ncbi:MAG: FtsW/RodA/SpoVE family cell cycle protein, partial [Eubacteriales bacterium]
MSNRINNTVEKKNTVRAKAVQSPRHNTKKKKSFWQELRSPAPVNTVYRVRGGVDTTFLIIVVLLLCFGTVMVFSASYAYAGSKFHDSLYFVKKQSVWALLGIAALVLFSFVDYALIRKLTLPIFCVSYLLLWCVFIPGIGVSSKGAQRWVSIGPLQFQPSDVMKFALVLLLAFYISYAPERMKKFKYGILVPASIIIVVCGTTILEHHVSGAVILFLIGAVMILISGASAKWLAGISGTAASVVAVIVFFTDYAKKRVDAWLHPENFLQSSGWQPYQSLLAIGSGGIFGVGLGNSYQKQLWLPEPQNDFIFAIICEELGLIGGLTVIALFLLLVWRGFVIAKRAPDTFSSLLVMGLVSKVGIQALLNIAVVTATIPTT